MQAPRLSSVPRSHTKIKRKLIQHANIYEMLLNSVFHSKIPLTTSQMRRDEYGFHVLINGTKLPHIDGASIEAIEHGLEFS